MPPDSIDQPTTLRDQWGVKPGLRVWVGGHNTDAKRQIETHLAGTTRPPTGPIDIAFIAPFFSNEAAHFATKLRDRLTSDGPLWVIHPDPAQIRAADFEITEADLRTALAATGYAPSGVVPMSDAYISTRFDLTGQDSLRSPR